MRLYYTVASQPEDLQQKVNLSLGGYKSSNPLPNASVGNLFGDISMYTVAHSNGNKYVGLILKNEGIKDATNIFIWFGYPNGCSSKLRIAAVDLISDGDGNLFMEHIPTYESKPLYAEFVEADGEAGKVNIGDLNRGEMMGIWFERELLLDSIKAEQNNIYAVNPTDPYRFNEVVLEKEDLIDINISWTDVG